MSVNQSSGSTGGELKPTLGLAGVTINAMALIAPGAFLWTTYQEQCAWGGTSMWPSVAVATFIALLTASCYAVMAKEYPQAGAGSSYFYAEAAFLEKESHDHFKFARIVKLFTGCAAHLYYWVYPGVMVTFMGTLLVFIVQIFNPHLLTAAWQQCAVCCVFSAITGFICFMGVNGSTMTNAVINVIQIIALISLSVLAIAFRMTHPHLPAGEHYTHVSAFHVIDPHGFTPLLFQTTIAILLVVGFESATALAGEAKDAKRDIPRGVILSLIIQAVIFYLFEYFAANYFIGDHFAGAVDKNGANFTMIDPTKVHSITDPSLDQKMYAGGSIVSGLAATGADAAPIGDMAHIIGDAMLNGKGQLFELIQAATVVLALIGTALSCLNTGVRVTYAMGKDNELPGPFGFLHGKNNTPHIAILILTILSAAIGSYGIINADNLIQITLLSNIGTFLLYGITCLLTYVAFSHVKGANVFTTKLIPIMGMIMNFGLMVGDFYFAFVAPSATAATKNDTKLALIVSFGFMIISFGYLAIRSAVTKTPMFLPPDHKETAVGA
ncbi:MAG: APC family permease [Capsulimonadaceae bacterium]